jgi:hypothetical protein
MRVSADFFLSVCEEGVVISRRDLVWFFSFDDLEAMENVEDFLEAIGC